MSTSMFDLFPLPSFIYRSFSFNWFFFCMIQMNFVHYVMRVSKRVYFAWYFAWTLGITFLMRERRTIRFAKWQWITIEEIANGSPTVWTAAPSFRWNLIGLLFIVSIAHKWRRCITVAASMWRMLFLRIIERYANRRLSTMTGTTS